MSSELRLSYNGSATLYAIIRDTATGYVWNGSALVAWVNGDIASYDIPLTSAGGDLYTADFPSGVTGGTYRVFYYEQAGGSPATTDLLLGVDDMGWDGVNATTPGDITLSAYALTSLDYLKTYMGITSSGFDDALTLILNGVSAEIERIAGRKFVARDYRTWLNVNGQQRLLLPQRPVQSITRISYGGAAAMTLTYGGSAIRANVSVYQDPETGDGGGLRLVSISTAGVKTANNLSFATYPSVSTLATAANLVSGWTAVAITNVPTGDLIRTGGEDAKSRTVTLSYPDQDEYGYGVDYNAGTVEFSRVSGTGWNPAADWSRRGMPAGGHQYMLIEYRAGYETVPADVQVLACDMSKEVYYARLQNTAAASIQLGPYKTDFNPDQVNRTRARLLPYMDGAAFIGGSV